MSIHEQARAEAEKRWPNGTIRTEVGNPTFRRIFTDGFLAGHEAATRTRVVTTVIELDALPVGSVVLSEQGAVFERDEVDMSWMETGVTWRLSSEDIALPARVLYEHEETR